MNKHVAKINATGNLKEAINKVVLELGGWSKYIERKDRVLLKPNFNTADPFPASTDLSFLKFCAELICENGASEVIIGESSTFSANTSRVMRKLGVNKLEKSDLPIKICNFDKERRIKRGITGGKFLKSVSLPQIINKVDKLILIPCCKTHYIAKYTGALKLSVGFMKKSEKILMHRSNVQEKIAELNMLVKPDLIIMDARKIFITEGPMDGEVRSPGVLLASESRIEIDKEGMDIIKGFAGNDLKDISEQSLIQLEYATKLGIDQLKEKSNI